jgi:segregation and condensation protein B
MWKMDVQQEYYSLITKLATGSSEFSKAEQETLAIIAYKQPIKQSVIIKIRGNKAYDHIAKFSDFGLIKKKKQGHTHILTLSEEFYNYFNVSSEENLTDKGLSFKITNEENLNKQTQENQHQENQSQEKQQQERTEGERK